MLQGLTSVFGSLDKNDIKHLGVEAGLTGLIASLGVVSAYFMGHSQDIGIVGPVLLYLCGLAGSALKKALTDNTVQEPEPKK